MPTHNATVSATCTVSLAGEGHQELEPSAITSLDSTTTEIRSDLSAEPIEPATLTIHWHRDESLVGFQRTIIQPGPFAAS